MPMSRDTIMQGVLDLLQNDIRCRNDDKYLIWRFIREKAGIKIFIPLEEFERMPSFESIRRIRAQIQNVDGLFLPTFADVRKRRQINEAEWREWLKKNTYRV